MIRPRTVAVNLRASPAFKAWLDAEKKRTNLTTRELLEAMVASYAGIRRGTIPWPPPAKVFKEAR